MMDVCNGMHCPNYDNCPLNHNPMDDLDSGSFDWSLDCCDLVSMYLKMKEIESLVNKNKEGMND